MQNLQIYVKSTTGSRLKQTGRFFPRAHEHSTKSVETCSTWNHARRIWGAQTHRKKTLL